MSDLNSQHLQPLKKNVSRSRDRTNISSWSQSYSNRVSHQDELKSISAWVDASNKKDIDTLELGKIKILKWITKRKRTSRKALLMPFFLVALIILISIILILLFALTPCLLTRCHEKASMCINYPFRPRCVCDYGYAGDGIEYCDECGIAFRQPNARIVGGVEAIEHSWPSAVLIIATYKTDIYLGDSFLAVDVSFMCGGTLIDRKNVLTAAHCVVESFEYEFKGVTYEIKVEANKYYPTLESMYRVYLGLQNRTTLTTGNISPAIYVSVDKIKIHEAYDKENVLNDIALLQLKKPVQLNRNIQIACLPNSKWSEFYPLPDTSAYVLGWGTLSEQEKTPDSLMNLKIEIYNNSICDQVIREDRKDWKSQICAGDIKGSRDTCQGDSGGGIYVKDSVNNKQKYISAGIVSYGDGCGKINKPGFYTRNIHFLDWIVEKSRW